MAQEGSDGSQYLLLVQSFANSFINRRLYKHLSLPTKSSQKSLANVAKFIICAFCILMANQFIYFASITPNLFKQANLSRSMSAQEIKQSIQDQKVQLMLHEEIGLNTRLAKAHKLDQIQAILTHSARRLTYDTFGITTPEYAWAFLSQEFMLSMVIQTSIFYLICLVMNLLTKQKSQMQSSFKFELVFVILVFITDIELIVHSQERLNQVPGDFLDRFYSAFTISERRHVMKSFIIPVMGLIQIFYNLYVETEAQKTLSDINSWSGIFLPVLNKLKQQDISRRGNTVEDQVGVLLEQFERQSTTTDEMRKLLKLYQEQRKLVMNYVNLEGKNIVQDRKFIKTMEQYFLIAARPKQD